MNDSIYSHAAEPDFAFQHIDLLTRAHMAPLHFDIAVTVLTSGFCLPASCQILELRGKLAESTASVQSFSAQSEALKRSLHDVQADRNAEVKSRENLASTNAQMNAVHVVLRGSHEQLERDRDALTQKVGGTFNQHVVHLLLALLWKPTKQSSRGTVSATSAGLASYSDHHI